MDLVKSQVKSEISTPSTINTSPPSVFDDSDAGALVKPLKAVSESLKIVGQINQAQRAQMDSDPNVMAVKQLTSVAINSFIDKVNAPAPPSHPPEAYSVLAQAIAAASASWNQYMDAKTAHADAQTLIEKKNAGIDIDLDARAAKAAKLEKIALYLNEQNKSLAAELEKQNKRYEADMTKYKEYFNRIAADQQNMAAKQQQAAAKHQEAIRNNSISVPTQPVQQNKPVAPKMPVVDTPVSQDITPKMVNQGEDYKMMQEMKKDMWGNLE